MNWKVLLLVFKMFGLDLECERRCDKLHFFPAHWCWHIFSFKQLKKQFRRWTHTFIYIYIFFFHQLFFPVEINFVIKYFLFQWRKIKIFLTNEDTTRSSVLIWLKYRTGRQWLQLSLGSIRTVVMPATTILPWRWPYIKSSKSIKTSKCQTNHNYVLNVHIKCDCTSVVLNCLTG